MLRKKRWALDAEIMKLRGLGYSQEEIAKKVKVSQATVHNKLEVLKKRAKEEGIDEVFFELCAKIYLPKILRFLKC